MAKVIEPAGDVKQEWLSPAQLGEELNIPLATIYVWRSRRTGPRGHKIGAHVRYSRQSINEWLASVADPKPAA
ncbi:helix-turn-helix domain-containing protein [Pseudarthrobacter psychrotolerans]|uniref:Helix-turn-helix domain-containing protein n=1 Tax=Pseudarthrobacter psychrotolerans TaxID=2697569 RepID=A0A6P1NII7_9MICC|nr:helix-turn-helix domain-containing protein [Pseudarthrobacter psychrotolerans]QHK19379.1 helix-turn-helix domain-containing protein [Pseudarthrobacter psychrotolerans]